MPAITISAVNTGTDALTATAHGLTTGDRFRLRNVDGALPAATPALAAGTDYFASVVDANTIKVYDTNAHAVAGGGTGLVDLTGAGSGTNTIEYGLPYSIPTIVAAPSGQIKSANDNGIWAALAALHQYFTGGSQSLWTRRGRKITQRRSAYGDPAESGTFGPSGAIWRLTTAGFGIIRLPELPDGARVTAVRLRAKDGTSSAITAVLTSDVDGTRTAINTQVTGGTNAIQTIPFGGLPITITAGTTYYLRVTAPTTTSDYYWVEVDYDPL